MARALTSNVGWTDAAEADWGDSHHGAWYKFNLAQDSVVSIQVTGLSVGTHNTVSSGNVPGTFNAANTLTDVGFTLYKGLFAGGAYDTASALPIPPGKDGRWDALGDTSMANDSGVIRTVTYVTHRNAETGNTETLLNLFLTAGDYSIGAGGAFDVATGDHTGSYGIQAQLLSVQAVPIPAAVWLFGSALAGMGVIGRRKQVAA